MTHAVANTRALAAEIVDRWLRTHAFPDRLLESVSADRAFVMEVVYGVVKRRRSLEWVVHRCARRTPDPGVMATLMVGLYQILCMDHVAPYAAVNETVEAIKIETARKSGVAHRGIVGFVNGVLRAALRDRESLMHDIESESLGIRESHPDELVRRWTEGFGDRRALKLCQWNNGRPEVCLRLNRRKTTVPAFVKLLAERSVSAKPHPFAPTECLVLCHAPRTADSAAPEHTDHDATAPRRIADLPGYANGLFNIQDPSTLTAVKLLNPQPGELVLDACASPGGKTVIIAERMHGEGQIVALERHHERFARLLENIERLRLGIVTPLVADALDIPGLERAGGGHLFDRVLLDVPCTNTGVLRRRPDARWRFTADRLQRLTILQRSLLESVSTVLRPGGVLVYSTCSLEEEENEGVVSAFCRDHNEFERGESVLHFPPETSTDGAFAAVLTRT